MRILYVLPFVPWPIKVRSFNLIPRLSKRHDIDLVCLARSKEDIAHVESIRGYCSSVRTGSYTLISAMMRSLLSLPTQTPLRIAYVSSNSMRRAVSAAIAENRPDVIYVERWRALQYVPRDNNIPVVCDPTDSMALYNYRLKSDGQFWERALGLTEYCKFRAFEAKLARSVSATVFCSRVDLEFLRQFAPDANLVQVVNGVDCDLFKTKQPGEERPGTIFFSGNFHYAPNRHAVTYFLREIYPTVKQVVPDATFVVVGNGAQGFINQKHSGTAGIVVRDFVPELRSHLATASIAVAPMTVGSGVSNKLLEAFATGTPIISTPVACGDLPVKDGEHLFIADSPGAFAEKVVLLLQNQTLRRKIASAALNLVRAHYDWNTVVGSMEAVLLDAIRGEESHAMNMPGK
jgi:glycosyltransferase involved in cell wall biosynthesis